MQHADFWVDDAAHLLHYGSRAFTCDREIVASYSWKNHALLLSADTDCLSLWDADGLIRTARTGIYPQDMAVQDDIVCVCGGTDGKLHMLSLPSLREKASFVLPGIPERVYIREHNAWVLSLLPEPEVCTTLLEIDLQTAEIHEITRLAGIPGVLAADAHGLWVGISEAAVHLPWETSVPDIVVEGIGLPEKVFIQSGGVVIIDGLDGRKIFVRT